MKKRPTVAIAMTPFPYCVDQNASLEFARQLMDRHRVRHLPVTGEHGVIGLITEQDLKSALGRGANRGAEQPGLSVNDVYRSKPYVVDLHEPLEHVLATMAERHIDAAIVTRAGRLAGVFTWVDACRSFAAFLRERFPHPADDGNDAA